MIILNRYKKHENTHENTRRTHGSAGDPFPAITNRLRVSEPPIPLPARHPIHVTDENDDFAGVATEIQGRYETGFVPRGTYDRVG